MRLNASYLGINLWMICYHLIRKNGLKCASDFGSRPKTNFGMRCRRWAWCPVPGLSVVDGSWVPKINYTRRFCSIGTVVFRLIRIIKAGRWGTRRQVELIRHVSWRLGPRSCYEVPWIDRKLRFIFRVFEFPVCISGRAFIEATKHCKRLWENVPKLPVPELHLRAGRGTNAQVDLVIRLCVSGRKIWTHLSNAEVYRIWLSLLSSGATWNNTWCRSMHEDMYRQVRKRAIKYHIMKMRTDWKSRWRK